MTTLRLVSPRPREKDRSGVRTLKIGRGGSRFCGLRFRHPDGREFVATAEWLDGAAFRIVRAPGGGERVAMVRPAAVNHHGKAGRGFLVSLDEWFVLAAYGPATLPITPPADVAEGPAPAGPGDVFRDEEVVTVFEANNFGEEPARGGEKPALSFGMWLAYVLLATLALILVLWASKQASADEPRQWSHPVYYQTCPGGRCPQPAAVTALYPSPSNPASAVAYRPAAVAARPGIVRYRTRCRFGRCR